MFITSNLEISLELISEQNWPNFFIVGAAKCGTTSLYEYLRRVPSIYMPTIKEPHYFAPNVLPTYAYRVIHDKDEYLKLFKDVKDEKAIGEASPSYLWDRDSPRIIHDFVPNARIIMILRDPVERAFSHYLMNVRNGSEKLAFCEALERDYNWPNKGWGISNLYIELGFYSEQVKKYLDIFGAERVKVLLFEDFVRDTGFAVKEVLRFLDVKSAVPHNVNRAYKSNNSFFVPRNQTSTQITNFIARSLKSNMTLYKISQSIPTFFKETIRETFLLQQIVRPKMPQHAKIFLEKIYLGDVIQLSTILRKRIHWPIISDNSSHS